ncbi:MAG: ZIP family metal transporter [Bacilli bacterium]|nr:ZIP family metal transporter [Bacilli bacterium]
MNVLLVTLGVGFFFLIGTLISLFVKNKNKLISFSLGISFILMFLLIITDIIPDALELFYNYRYFSLVGGALVGFGGILILEKLVPHHHDHNINKDHNHLIHIGIMTSIALIIHNIVEGVSIGVLVQTSLKTGLIYAFSVGLHNIPFGIKVSSMLLSNKKKMWIYTFLLTLSTFVGSLLLYVFNNLLSNFILGILLSITVGMIIYIIIFELLTELKEKINKYSVIGIITGIIIILIGLVI